LWLKPVEKSSLHLPILVKEPPEVTNSPKFILMGEAVVQTAGVSSACLKHESDAEE
jgi:hypothetical protein